MENDSSYDSAYLAPNFTGDETDLRELHPAVEGNAAEIIDERGIYG